MPVIEQRSVKKYNGAVPRERDLRQWWRGLSSIAVGIMVVLGFAVAARQHFTAHEFSVENVKLQRECEQLKNEQKRLLLEREMALSLDRLKQKAVKIGLQGITVNQITALPAMSENSEFDQVKASSTIMTPNQDMAKTGKVLK